MRKTVFEKDLANKKLFISREFDGTIEEVWQAWTNSDILDQWWAPKPWKANTKTMNFAEGGTWLYCMEGPGGERHWAKAIYNKIRAGEYFELTDAFCDENGNDNPDQPKMHWKTTFKPSGNATLVEIAITFPSQKDLEAIMEMGFQEGFTAAHENLDQYLAAKRKTPRSVQD